MQTDENPTVSLEADMYSALFSYKISGGIQSLGINTFWLVQFYIAWALIQLSACAFLFFLDNSEGKSYGKFRDSLKVLLYAEKRQKWELSGLQEDSVLVIGMCDTTWWQLSIQVAQRKEEDIPRKGRESQGT